MSSRSHRRLMAICGSAQNSGCIALMACKRLRGDRLQGRIFLHFLFAACSLRKMEPCGLVRIKVLHRGRMGSWHSIRRPMERLFIPSLKIMKARYGRAAKGHFPQPAFARLEREGSNVTE